MALQLLDGRALAAERMPSLATRAAQVAGLRGRPVGLGVILVGDDPASALYVRNKARLAKRLGLESRVVRLPTDVSMPSLLAQIASLNDDPSIDAFLLQLPLPASLQPLPALLAIAPHKDADGLHPDNVGRSCIGLPAPLPCTPAGCMALLAAAKTPLRGAHAVVIGRSNIVGQPMARALLAADATVTVCHSRTQHLAHHLADADVVVAAAGQPELVRGEWLRAGVTVIDVGIHRRPQAPGGFVGDVHAPSVREVAHALTPVPGGVGPMTILMLMDNAILAAERTVRR